MPSCLSTRNYVRSAARSRRGLGWSLLATASGVLLLLCSGALAGPAGPAPPERYGMPEPAAFQLELRIRGDTDRLVVQTEQLAWRIEERIVDAPTATSLLLEGLGFRKPRGDRARAELRLRLRAILKGDAPKLTLHCGSIGGVEVELRSGRKVLATAHVGDDEPRVAELKVTSAALRSLPGHARRRFERLALAFYYPWYGHPQGPTGRWRHWNPKHPQHAATHKPALGYYDSQDPAVMDQHARWAKEAGLDGLLLSWWGPTDPPDAHVSRWFDVAAQYGLRLSLYVEDCRDGKTLRQQMRSLLQRLGNHRSWLRVGGRPVVFVYGRIVDKLGGPGLAEALGGLGLHINAMGLDTDLLAHVDALHVYFHARHYERYVGGLDILRRAGALWDTPVVATVMPGYDDKIIRKPGFSLPRGDGSRWRHDWALARGADWVLVTSFNEWHEGSEIEPSEQLGRAWLDDTATEIRAWKATP